jgi:hypothetical protein
VFDNEIFGLYQIMVDKGTQKITQAALHETIRREVHARLLEERIEKIESKFLVKQ